MGHGGWLKAQWGCITGESQEGLVLGYRQKFTKHLLGHCPEAESGVSEAHGHMLLKASGEKSGR